MRPKPLSKEQILTAMAHTRSNRSAARFLGCSYGHYKGYAKLYKDENGISLFEKHLNPHGKGIPRYVNGGGRKNFPILDIIEGKLNPSNYEPNKIKYALISEGLLRDCCSNCGFHERRVSDFKIPLLLHFEDGNKSNYRLNNVRLYCYNCFFLTVGDVFTKHQEKTIQEPRLLTHHEVEWELDDFQKQKLKSLNLLKPEPKINLDKIDPNSLISRI